MQPHVAELGRSLDALLARLQPPSSLPDDSARASERAALLAAILRHAPPKGWAGWWEGFEARLLEARTGRVWPTVGEIARAARQSSPSMDVAQGERWKANTVAIEAGRMQAGEPVGEYWCEGRGADLMARQGVSPDRIAAYGAALSKMRARMERSA